MADCLPMPQSMQHYLPAANLAFHNWSIRGYHLELAKKNAAAKDHVQLQYCYQIVGQVKHLQ